MNRPIFIVFLPLIALVAVLLSKLTKLALEREDLKNMWRSATIGGKKGV